MRFPDQMTTAPLLLMAQLIFSTSVATCQPSPHGLPEETYHQLQTRLARQMFDGIRVYCQDHPGAADFPTAARELFSLARTWGWEAEARNVAGLLLARPDLDPAVTREAQVVLALGAARVGERDGSAAAFQQYLRSLRLRTPNDATDLAQSLALVWQLRGDVESAAAVYEQLATAFFLNPEVREFTEARIKRLSLVGKPVPEFAVSDLSGQPVVAADFTGRVTLLDFWATNCRPCLEELPHLRELYRDCQPRGLAILGLSFDGEREILDQFLSQQPLPWRIALGRMPAEDVFHVHLIPCLMLVDRQGRIAATDVRPFDLRRTLEGLLDQRP
jgi:thiol-disulfide isomerase/thioredoxin